VRNATAGTWLGFKEAEVEDGFRQLLACLRGRTEPPSHNGEATNQRGRRELPPNMVQRADNGF
jgi:hypothetical protein